MGLRFDVSIFKAPWEGPARPELVSLVQRSIIPPGRAIDLGCGSGANAIFLAEHGFDVVGVDFSDVALAKAAQAAEQAAASVRLVRGDLTGGSLAGIEGTFDLVVDFGTLDDFRGAKRLAVAQWFTRLTHPGSRALLWCFYGPFDGLPTLLLDKTVALGGRLKCR